MPYISQMLSNNDQIYTSMRFISSVFFASLIATSLAGKILYVNHRVPKRMFILTFSCISTIISSYWQLCWCALPCGYHLTLAPFCNTPSISLSRFFQQSTNRTYRGQFSPQCNFNIAWCFGSALVYRYVLYRAVRQWCVINHLLTELSSVARWTSPSWICHNWYCRPRGKQSTVP